VSENKKCYGKRTQSENGKNCITWNFIICAHCL
jgi:hypothetical protein